MALKEIIEYVDSLGSPASLKKWVKRVYKLTRIPFNKTSTYNYDFTKKDIILVQNIANSKAFPNLGSSFLHVFNKSREPPLPFFNILGS